METILLAVTVVSLLVALIMSATAWRLSREERARAAARVAALAGAASDPVAAPPVAPEPIVVAAVPVPAPARASVFVAPRAVAAPAAELALNASSAADELPLRPMPSIVERSAPRLIEPVAATPAAAIADTFLGGGGTREQSGNGQRRLMVAAAVLSVFLGGGAYWLISGDSLTTDAASAAAPTSTSPLELISLRHERRGSRLALSGLVRNPSAGAAVEDLNAVVFLFDGQGAFVSSARAGVDFKRLAAGDESPFVVTMDAPSNVARYRVSFRNESGIVAHVDRRSEQPVATTVVR